MVPGAQQRPGTVTVCLAQSASPWPCSPAHSASLLMTGNSALVAADVALSPLCPHLLVLQTSTVHTGFLYSPRSSFLFWGARLTSACLQLCQPCLLGCCQTHQQVLGLRQCEGLQFWDSLCGLCFCLFSVTVTEYCGDREDRGSFSPRVWKLGLGEQGMGSADHWQGLLLVSWRSRSCGGQSKGQSHLVTYGSTH